MLEGKLTPSCHIAEDFQLQRVREHREAEGLTELTFQTLGTR